MVTIRKNMLMYFKKYKAKQAFHNLTQIRCKSQGLFRLHINGATF